MVATRRGAKVAPEVAPAPANTLNAPPKRGRKKAVEEAAEPAPAVSKPTKAPAAKRKAKPEPEVVEPPVAKKTVATRTTRAVKVETKAEPAPAAPKRATRGRKVEEAAVAEEPAVTEPAPKPAATRGRKAPAKKADAPKAEEPATVEEPVVEEAPKPASRARKAAAVVEEPVAEEAPKPASRTRKAPVKKAPATKKVEIVEETHVVEPVKPAPRVRKAAAPPKESAPAPVAASRATRGRNVPAAPQESPLKAPARKPVKKAAPVVPAKSEPVPVQEPFVQYPDYPTTPAHIAAPLTARKAMAELPQYPSTPAHILAPISTKDALAALPGYPKTPAHITASISAKAALAEMPDYPETPAHIKAPSPVQDITTETPDDIKTPVQIEAPEEPITTDEDAMQESPSYPEIHTPIVAPVEPVEPETIDNEDAIQELPDCPETHTPTVTPEEPGTSDNEDVMQELPDYPNTPAHIVAPMTSKDALKELPDYPKTPAHITAPMATKDALNELPGYPKTPAHIQAPFCSNEKPAELRESPTTPAQVAVSAPVTDDLSGGPADASATPIQTTSPVQDAAIEGSGTPQVPANIVWGVTDQEAFQELPAGYPNTPAHITAPVTTPEASAELPESPRTPVRISTPLTPRRALAELPSYPTTPAMAIEAAIQEEITASVKKQTPSPMRFPDLEDVSFQFAENSEITDVDATEIHSEAPSTGPKPKFQLAPLQLPASLPAPDLASPKKSALRSPQKTDAKTPKKAVTWDDPEESELFLYDGPLQGMNFFVDVTSNGRDQNFLFTGLLEDLGAKVVKEWASTGISHVLYKDGSQSTLEKVLASKGAIKCVNVGWVLDSEKNKKRMDEASYLVDLSSAMPTSPLPTTTLKPFTPARTPSKYALPPSSECKSVPSTPTSSEFDRSINLDDKENQEHGIYFDCLEKEVRTVPQKKSSFLFSRSPIKTPSKPSFLTNTPVKAQSSIQPFTTGKKRTLAESSFPGISMGKPKKLRFF